jgi:hypothetical protein
MFSGAVNCKVCLSLLVSGASNNSVVHQAMMLLFGRHVLLLLDVTSPIVENCGNPE